MQLKHSRTTGAVPNLIPGEIGVNLADRLVYLRSGGHKLPIDVDQLNARGAPRYGPSGAPIEQGASGVQWSRALTPSSLLFGRIHTDAPPIEGYEVPGFYAATVAPTMPVTGGDTLVEPFNVASDDLTLTAIMVNVAATETGPLRVGIADASGTVVVDSVIVAPQLGPNVVSANVPLARGGYAAVLWAGVDMSFGQIAGYRAEQGFDIDEAGGLLFVQRRFGPSGDFSGGLPQASIEATITSASPGERRAVLFGWRLGA